MSDWHSWESVTESGWYWHWNGDLCCSPLPLSVLRDSASMFFASAGQLGFSYPIMLNDLGGWFIKMTAPEVDKEKAVECGH